MTRRIAALLLGAGATMAAAVEKAGAEAADARLRPVLEAMLSEPLEATSPAGLRTASYLLARRFNRGADDVDGYVYLLKLLCGQALRLAEQHPDAAADYQEAAVATAIGFSAPSCSQTATPSPRPRRSPRAGTWRQPLATTPGG